MTSAGCLLCGADLVYEGLESRRSCAICGASASSNARCTAGHFVCDRCHALGAMDLIYQICRTARTTCPGDLAERIMQSPVLHMHGPEHHFLVPAVLLAAYATARGLAQDERDRMLDEARRRAEVVRGGFCGFWGACGAGVGTGIFVSVATGATPLSKREWRLANAMTSAALGRIAKNGARDVSSGARVWRSPSQSSGPMPSSTSRSNRRRMICAAFRRRTANARGPSACSIAKRALDRAGAAVSAREEPKCNNLAFAESFPVREKRLSRNRLGALPEA